MLDTREKMSANCRLGFAGGAGCSPADGSGGGGGHGPGSSGGGLLAGLAVPDADGGALDGVLAAEGARVGGVLGDLHLLDRLAESGSVTDTVLSSHSGLSGPR